MADKKKPSSEELRKNVIRRRDPVDVRQVVLEVLEEQKKAKKPKQRIIVQDEESSSEEEEVIVVRRKGGSSEAELERHERAHKKAIYRDPRRLERKRYVPPVGYEQDEPEYQEGYGPPRQEQYHPEPAQQAPVHQPLDNYGRPLMQHKIVSDRYGYS